MRIRFLLVSALPLAFAPIGAAAQGSPSGTLPAFASDGDLLRYLGRLAAEDERLRPAPAPLPAAPCLAGMTPEPAAVPRDTTRPAVIIGRVTDASGRPMAAAQLRVAELNAGALSGCSGWFRLVVPASRLRDGQSVVISASRLGFNPISRSITLERGATVTFNVVMSAAALSLQGLVVTNGMAGAESVTNTQHEGVDEGGIVKVHGDYLVMLRRGRLFTVSVGDGQLRPISTVNAYAPGAEPASYYDELLISGDRVIVVGYGGEGTEINQFRIDSLGGLRHRSTHHLSSNDYYSSRNYASRLIGTRLIFYTPLYMHTRTTAEGLARALPGIRRWRKGERHDSFRRTLTGRRIFRPGRALPPTRGVALHTVTICELARAEMECESTALLGPQARDFYVSPTSVYVWVSDWNPADKARSPSTLYRIPLDGSAPSSLGVEGAPVDQFSFLEADGMLNVLVRGEGAGDAMWSSLRARGDVALLRVPISRFGGGGARAPRRSYLTLPAARDGYFQNRFVGNHLLYGSGNGWGRARPSSGEVLTVLRLGERVAAQLDLVHPVDRIEVMGSSAVVVGAAGRDLHFTGIDLSSRPHTAQHFVRPGASQGELRSHGFFYKPDGEDSGIIGLPIRGPGRPGYEHLFEHSSSMLFLRNQGDAFRTLGELDAHAAGAVDDNCQTSCDDWYGNSRPLFLRGRVFALLGYELVEGRVEAGRMREVRRIDYAPRRARPTD